MTEDSIRDGIVMLGAALALVLLFRRLGLGATLGYLIAGMIIGPYGLHLVGDAEGKIGVAELGITLLLFVVGLELNLTRLWRLRRDIFGFGFVQVVMCGIALSAVVFYFTGNSRWRRRSRWACRWLCPRRRRCCRCCNRRGACNTPFGERAFSILLFQDLSIVPLITIIAALMSRAGRSVRPPGWLLAIYTVVAVVGLIAVGRYAAQSRCSG
jgi:glutathione-regulated potassium-efflux system protein KefB